MNKNYTIDDRPYNHPEVVKRREDMLNSLSKEEKEKLDNETQKLLNDYNKKHKN